MWNAPCKTRKSGTSRSVLRPYAPRCRCLSGVLIVCRHLAKTPFAGAWVPSSLTGCPRG